MTELMVGIGFGVALFGVVLIAVAEEIIVRRRARARIIRRISQSR